MVHCIGEILLDMFGEDKSHSLELNAKLGGAPFNVAANIAVNGGYSSFYGVLGDDQFGDFAAKEASRYPLKRLILDRSKSANTTLAVVTIDNGERSFRFLRSPGADYLLDEDRLHSLGIKAGDFVHFGSLLLSKKEGRSFLRKAISYCHKAGAFVSFDANLRLDIFRDEEETKEIYGKLFPMVDVLKLSEDELSFFCGKEDAEAFHKERLKRKSLLFVSYGSKGSAVVTRDGSLKVSSHSVKPVDTTGAGDAFYARVLLELDSVGDLMPLSAVDYESILIKANADGAKAVSHFGALPILED